MKVRDFTDGLSTVTGIVKGNKKLTVSVPRWVRDEVAAWLECEGIVAGAVLPRAPSCKGSISGAMVWKIVARVAARAGLPKGSISPHGLRRTNITLGGEMGVSLKARQLSVGHSSSATTERYDKAQDATRSAPGDVFADMVKRKSKKES